MGDGGLVARLGEGVVEGVGDGVFVVYDEEFMGHFLLSTVCVLFSGWLSIPRAGIGITNIKLIPKWI